MANKLLCEKEHDISLGKFYFLFLFFQLKKIVSGPNGLIYGTFKLIFLFACLFPLKRLVFPVG